jgi:hypothetical protein
MEALGGDGLALSRQRGEFGFGSSVTLSMLAVPRVTTHRSELAEALLLIWPAFLRPAEALAEVGFARQAWIALGATRRTGQAEAFQHAMGRAFGRRATAVPLALTLFWW